MLLGKQGTVRAALSWSGWAVLEFCLTSRPLFSVPADFSGSLLGWSCVYSSLSCFFVVVKLRLTFLHCNVLLGRNEDFLHCPPMNFAWNVIALLPAVERGM